MTHSSLTEELEYWNLYLKQHPHDVNGHIRRGMTWFKLAQIAESIDDFDRAEQLQPDVVPYLWQRGLSYYYVDRFAEGAQQFEVDLQVNGHDVEETVWRCLCMARSENFAIAQQGLLPVKTDPRPVMRYIYDLFAGTCSPEVTLAMGNQGGDRGNFYAHLYVGLWYEAKEQADRAQHHIVTAAQRYPLEDYMWHVARVHQQIRGWS